MAQRPPSSEALIDMATVTAPDQSCVDGRSVGNCASVCRYQSIFGLEWHVIAAIVTAAIVTIYWGYHLSLYILYLAVYSAKSTYNFSYHRLYYG